MLETSSLSVLFLIDTVSSSRSAVMSLAVKRLPDIQNNSLNHSESETSNEPMKELVFVFTRDGHCISIDGTTGKAISQPVYPREASTAISFFILGKSKFFNLNMYSFVGIKCCNSNRTSFDQRKL